MCSVQGNGAANETCFQNETVTGTPRCINLLSAYEGLMVLLLSFYVVAIVLAILGNTLIIYIVYSNRSARTSTNIFIANMAVCDLGMPFLVLPMRIANLSIGSVWLIPGDAGLVLCKLIPFVHDVFIDCSTLSLLLITYDRYCALLLPHKRHLLSKRVIVILISCSWLVSISINSIMLKILSVYHVNGKTFCAFFWSDVRSYTIYYIILICLFIVLPILLVSIAYSAILNKLKKHVLTIGNSLSDRQRQQEHLRQRKIIKMAFAIVCAFAVCWLPFAIMIFIRIALIFSSQSPFSLCWFKRGLSISYYFLTLISVTNPAVCFTFGATFRKELCKLFRRVFGCCFRRRVVVVDMAMSETKL